MYFNSLKEINRLSIKKCQTFTIVKKLLLRKTDALETSIF